MNGDMIITLIWFAGALTLVGSALLHRGLSQRGALKLVLVWVGIILGAWAAVTLVGKLLPIPT